MKLGWISRSANGEASIDMVATQAVKAVDKIRSSGSLHLISIGTRALHTTGTRGTTIMPTHQDLGVLVGNQREKIAFHGKKKRKEPADSQEPLEGMNLSIEVSQDHDRNERK